MTTERKLRNKSWHLARHRELHDALDELVADWAIHQPRGKVYSNSTIMELIEWSYQQTIEPQEPTDDASPD